MTDLVVVRGEGHRPGEDIVDALLVSDQLALARGRKELDEGELANRVDLTIPLRDVRVGETVQVNGPLVMLTGKIIAVSHRVAIDEDGNLSGETQISVKVPYAST
jgi:hypothetical protein